METVVGHFYRYAQTHTFRTGCCVEVAEVFLHYILVPQTTTRSSELSCESSFVDNPRRNSPFRRNCFIKELLIMNPERMA